MKLEDLKLACAGTQWNEKLQETAREVLKTRGDRLPEIQNRKAQMESFALKCREQLKLMRAQFEKAKDNENCDVLIEKFCDEKISYIDKILLNLNEYGKKLGELTARFMHPKIRISSVGEKSVGKSTFIAKLLGLDEDDPIVMTKARGVTADYTGTVNVLHHVGNMTGESIKVILYSKCEIIAIVNDYLDHIRQIDGRENWTLPDGIFEIKSFEQLRKLCDNMNSVHACFDTLRDASSGSVVSESIMAVEKYFYLQEADGGLKHVAYLSLFDDVVSDDENKVIRLNSKQQLAEYNFMQYPEPKYMAVKNIDITMNMQNGGLFEQFDLVDTKGASVAAGLQANQEMFDEIDYSDAVIVICRGSQEEGTTFINGPLLTHVNKNKCKDKMFLVVNVDTNVVDIDEYLRSAKFSNCFNESKYYGRFVDDPDVNAVDFIRLTVQHLLGSIAEVVKENDNNAILSLDSLATNISSMFKNLLGNGWEQLNLVADVDEDKLLWDKLIGISKDVVDAVNAYDDLMQFDNQSDYSYDEYKRLVSEGKIDSIEKILFDGESRVDLESNNFYDVSEELKAVMQAHSTYFTDSYRKYSKNVCGEYVDDFCSKWYRLITDALVYKLAEQQELSIEELKIQLLGVLWEKYKLKDIFGNKVDIDVIRNMDNQFFNRLARTFGYDYHGQAIDVDKFKFSCYAVLKELFSCGGLSNEDDSDEMNESIFGAIANLAREYRLEEMAYLHNPYAPSARRSFFQTIATVIDNDKVFAQDTLSFYRQYSNKILEKKDVKRIDFSREINELLNCKENLLKLVSSESDFNSKS